MAMSSRLHKFQARRSPAACLLAFLFISLLFIALPAISQNTPTATPAKTDLLTQKYLFGDWNGERTKLEEEKGVKFDFFYVGDFLGNVQGGGTEKFASWNRVRGTIDLDFEKLAHVKGLSFHITGLWQGGVNLGGGTNAQGVPYLGSIANPSGLVSARTERLDSWWFEEAMFQKKVKLRFGQFAGMDFYGVQNYGGNYLAEPLDYAFGNLFTTYESFDPAAGPAAQLEVDPIPQLYFKAAYMSGNRNPYADDTTGFNFVKKDSGVFVDEVGFKYDQPGTKSTKTKLYPGLYKIGSAYNGGKFADPFTNVPLYLSPYTSNYLVYFMANQAIFRPTAGSNTGLDVHFGMDFAPDQTYNKIDRQLTLGFVYNGPIPKRSKDSIAFGIINSHVSSMYSQAYMLQSLGATHLGSETAYELNYLAQVTPWYMIQPVVQIYQDLGANPRNGTGVVLGFRTKVTF